MDHTVIPEAVVANSQYAARYLGEIYRRPVSSVVYPGVDPDLFVELPIDPNLFVTIGQLWNHKRVRLLIEAIATFCGMGLDVVILNLHVDANGPNGLELVSIQHVLDIASHRKSPLRFVVQLCPYVIHSVEKIVQTIEVISKLFSGHFYYLKMDKKPILFWFWTGVLDGNRKLINELIKASAEFINIAVSLRLPHAIGEAESTFHLFDAIFPFSPLELSSKENWSSIWKMAYQNAQQAGMRYQKLRAQWSGCYERIECIGAESGRV